jgi:hypothetical protein
MPPPGRYLAPPAWLVLDVTQAAAEVSRLVHEAPT